MGLSSAAASAVPRPHPSLAAAVVCARKKRSSVLLSSIFAVVLLAIIRIPRTALATIPVVSSDNNDINNDNRNNNKENINKENNVKKAEEAPTCLAGSMQEECRTSAHRMMLDQCALLQFGQNDEDTMVVSGQNVQKGEYLNIPADVAIPVTLHADVSQGIWPMWHRYVYFHPQAPNETLKDLVFSPGLRTRPFPCHDRRNNVEPTVPLNELVRQQVLERQQRQQQSSLEQEQRRVMQESADKNKQYKARAPIRKGDIVYVTCEDDAKPPKGLPTFPLPWYTMKDSELECIDRIAPGPSDLHGKGAFARFPIRKDEVFATADMIHVHRSELLNKETSEQELLLNYCFGNPRSPMLMLPSGYMVNYINHASGNKKEPNVAIGWTYNYIFDETSDAMMLGDENSIFNVEYYALREIEAGEELVMDYGREFQRALDEHRAKCGAATVEGAAPSEQQQQACLDSFRHEIALPEGMYPEEWLEQEVLVPPKLPSWDLPDLEPGQVEQLSVRETGERPAKYSVRVGLPPELSKKMLDYADKMGITEWLRHHVNHEDLKNQRTVQKNLGEAGGNWWLTSFDSSWQSNMHYVTPNDPVATMDFLSALSDAGYDTVLDGMAKHYGMNGILCYYPSFIAVSHCTGTMLHADAENSDGKGWNMIFPVLQINDTAAELNLGYDEPQTLVLPYRYEPNAAITLGDDGLHGTAPCDYRSRKDDSIRMVVSVYFADIDEDSIDAIDWDSGTDPPYPPYKIRTEYLRKNAGRDWNAKDPKQKLPTRQEFEAVVLRGERPMNQDLNAGYTY